MDSPAPRLRFVISLKFSKSLNHQKSLYTMNLSQQPGPVHRPQPGLQHVARASTRGAFQLKWVVGVYLMLNDICEAP